MSSLAQNQSVGQPETSDNRLESRLFPSFPVPAVAVPVKPPVKTLIGTIGERKTGDGNT